MALSIVFALLSAVVFALSMHVQKRALALLDDLTGTFVTLATMTAMYWLVIGWSIRGAFWHSEAVPYFVVAGVMFPAVSQRLQLASNKHVGPALTSAFGAFLPFFAAVPALYLLGETLTPQQIVGISLLAGALFLAAIARGVSWKSRAFYLLLLPLAAALVRAFGMPISKAGLNLLAQPFFAITVMASVSVAVVFAMLVVAGEPRRVLAVSRGHGLFMLNGVMAGTGMLGLQISLLTGSVSVTTSIVATTPIWTVVTGALFFRSEQLKWWHGVVAAAVCLGAILIVLGAAAH